MRHEQNTDVWNTYQEMENENPSVVEVQSG